MNNCPRTPPPGYACDGCKWFAYGGDTAKAANCSNWRKGGGCRPGGYVNSAFFDYDDGKPAAVSKHHPAPGFYQADDGDEGEYAGYSASIVANKSIAWIRKVAATGKPWSLVVGNRAPHAPFTPAPWYDKDSYDIFSVAKYLH